MERLEKATHAPSRAAQNEEEFEEKYPQFLTSHESDFVWQILEAVARQVQFCDGNQMSDCNRQRRKAIVRQVLQQYTA